MTQQAVNALFPGSSNIEDDDDELDDKAMHITVNTFEDPEELILDEEDPKSRSKLSRIQDSIKELGSAAYSKAIDHNPLQPPKSKVCCSVM